MKTDRELLELAAKTSGREVGREDQADPIDRKFIPELGLWCIGPWAGWFNPLIDDGDALQLAVKLHLRIDISDMHRDTEVSWHQEYGRKCEAGSIIEKWAENKNAATRRAIVRAAAAIGEHML